MSFTMHKLFIFTLMAGLFSGSLVAQNPDSLLLKNYRPRSVYQTPQAEITRAVSSFATASRC